MKRYLMFQGDMYYPAGGWADLTGSFDGSDSHAWKVMTVDCQSAVAEDLNLRRAARGTVFKKYRATFAAA
jgi:hypothetical protein